MVEGLQAAVESLIAKHVKELLQHSSKVESVVVKA